MGVSVEKGDFADRDHAVRQIEGRGLFARDGAMAAGDLEDIHWHKTSLSIYVLSGSFETLDAASGECLRVFADTETADEFIISDGVLLARTCVIPDADRPSGRSDSRSAALKP